MFAFGSHAREHSSVFIIDERVLVHVEVILKNCFTTTSRNTCQLRARFSFVAISLLSLLSSFHACGKKLWRRKLPRNYSNFDAVLFHPIFLEKKLGSITTYTTATYTNTTALSQSRPEYFWHLQPPLFTTPLQPWDSRGQNDFQLSRA